MHSLDYTVYGSKFRTKVQQEVVIMFKKILVPLDGSRFASRSLKYAVEIAQRFDAEIRY